MLAKLWSRQRYRLTLAVVVPAAVVGAIAASFLLAGRGGGGEEEATTTKGPPVVVVRVTPTPTLVPREPALIDGVLVPVEELERAQGRLPLAVVFDNHPAARPQFGLDRAELVYEVVAEGGITRFLAVYWHNDVDLLMPVRSARVYYLPWALELDALFVHYGGAEDPPVADVYSHIYAYDVRNIDGLVLSTGVFWRDTSRRAPHNAATSSANLWEWASKREWLGPPALEAWPFKEDGPGRAPPEGGKAAVEVSLSFGPWNKASYSVEWEYDPALNAYRRLMGGTLHIDGASKNQIVAKNVVVQFAELSFAGDGIHILFETVGEGDAIVFQDGVAVPATWRKADRNARTRFFDTAGNEIAFNRGPTWVEVLAYGSPLTY